MRRRVIYPLAAWPLEMRARTAAAYCDEPSSDAFLRKVELGIYSQPTREKGMQPKWHRSLLDRDIARRHGLNVEQPATPDDLADLI